MENIPVVGMLIVPRHKQSFCTILEVVLKTQSDTEIKGPQFYVLYLRISDSKKIRTIWYPNSEVFWKYYEEK